MTVIEAQTSTGRSQAILQGFTMSDIQDIAEQNPNLRGYLQGYLAEKVLFSKIAAVEGVESVVKIPDSDRRAGDFLVTYLGHEITIEAKSLATGTAKYTETDWSGVVRVKNVGSRMLEVPGRGLVKSSNLVKGNFDILAICCIAATGEWDFLFMEELELPERSGFPGFIRASFRVGSHPSFGATADLKTLLDKQIADKLS